MSDDEILYLRSRLRDSVSPSTRAMLRSRLREAHEVLNLKTELLTDGDVRRDDPPSPRLVSSPRLAASKAWSEAFDPWYASSYWDKHYGTYLWDGANNTWSSRWLDGWYGRYGLYYPRSWRRPYWSWGLEDTTPLEVERVPSPPHSPPRSPRIDPPSLSPSLVSSWSEKQLRRELGLERHYPDIETLQLRRELGLEPRYRYSPYYDYYYDTYYTRPYYKDYSYYYPTYTTTRQRSYLPDIESSMILYDDLSSSRTQPVQRKSLPPSDDFWSTLGACCKENI